MPALQHDVPDIANDFNLEYLQMVSGGEKSVMFEFFDLLQSTTGPLIDEALGTAAAADWGATGKLLHKLKGQLGILTMEATVAMVVQMEHTAQSNTASKEGLLPLLQVLKDNMPLALQKVKTAIEAL